MPNINQIKQSKFLKREDVGRGLLLTITGCHQENVAKTGEAPEMKWCLTFVEHEKPMVLNSINAQLIAQFLGSAETDQWIGKKVVLYDDPSIMFGGQLKGGIRARAPRLPAAAPAPAAAPVPQQNTVAAPAPAPVAAAADSDEPPF
jgi:hypothetical protein